MAKRQRIYKGGFVAVLDRNYGELNYEVEKVIKDAKGRILKVRLKGVQESIPIGKIKPVIPRSMS